ncbi:hypothetical protein CAPTEDRAFT_223820 [Capitella teleta]|uniref:Uncharacterized protein n=1 Tax=Capitella teleta TaxID=283909 RepID=R7TQV7_CAPTE|nr:hypothetical protein CAPTEDRAFT_223820 [Capitella teleta]|eukprot:ELT96049.1 hypothetical protein CAPTEDRAFT_223820 [Capitella teleta]
MRYLAIITLALCCVAALAIEYHPLFGGSVRGADRRRALLECKNPGHACSGLPKCCDDYQCYWEDGYSPFTDGVCVECVQQNQLCQRDAQCCHPLVCQKAKAINKDGVCEPKRIRGQPCHEDDQCQSASCNQKWYQFSEGECE